MHDHHASLTAKLVASFRGLADDPAAPGHRLDPWAERLLPAPWGCAMRALGPLARAPGLHRVYNAMGLTLPDHVELRTRTLDALVRQHSRSGEVAQLVVLGAGFDARALRLPELSACAVFEVDHPATQAVKRAAGVAYPEHVRFVGVDFTRDDLAERLAAQGHRANAPTLWLWEGVTPYLPPDATRESLTRMASRSAPGSIALITWCRTSMSSWTRGRSGDRDRGQALFRRIGEPLLGLMDDDAFAAMLAETGWRPRAHSGMRDWAATAGWPRPRVIIEERVMVAERAP
jgi:methyltransferase (TIGR00027 family)